MSGEAGPSKARKFKPTVPARRKKVGTEDVAVKAENDETFKDLIRAAQEPANWERRPHQRQTAKSVGAQQVVFGGAQTGFASINSRGGSQWASAPSQVGASGPGQGGPGHGSGPGPGSGGGSGSGAGTANGARAGESTKARRIVKHSEPWLNEDLKDQQQLMEPPTVEADDEDLNLNSYYPTTLPMRQPGAAPQAERPSGGLDAELMNEDREDQNVADALGLLSIADEPRPADIILQLPSVLPAPVSNSKDEPLDRRRRLGLYEAEAPRKTALSLSELPPGKIGKLLVFESGKVKLQLGDVLLDVSRAADCQCFQHVVAMNLESKSAVSLGEIQHKAICTPDMDQLLSDSPIPDWERVPPDSPVRGPRKRVSVKSPKSPSSPKNPKSPKRERRAMQNGAEPMEIDGGAHLNGSQAGPSKLATKAAIFDSDDDDQ